MRTDYQGPILIVEDSDGDYEAALWALRKSSSEVPVVRCTNGDQAIDYLEDGKGQDGNEKFRFPAIILLDLNLPRSDGRHVLNHIKSSERLKSIPVIVVTTSSVAGDVHACYLLGANSYVVKPVNMVHLQELMGGLVEYWFRLVLLPRLKESHGD